MATKKKDAGYHPGADPTAPGGMSEKALVAELVDKHGWNTVAADDLTWTEKIDAVCTERRAREIEQAQPEEAQPEQAQPEPLLLLDPDTYDFRFDNHAGAGPSGAHRWMNCSGSLRMTREFLESLSPNQQAAFAGSSEAAREGTTAHAAGEIHLNLMLGRVKAKDAKAALAALATEPPEGERYTEEMADFVAEYVDLIKGYADEGREILVESRLSAAVPLTGDHEGEVYEVKGSADAVALPTKTDPTLVVADLKYGDGLFVSAEENPQTRIYALGALAELADDEGNIEGVEEIEYVIAQPRFGGIKTWRESIYDLMEWRDETLAPALTAALFDGTDLNPSDEACEWCPVQASCPALAKQVMDGVGDLFDAVTEAEMQGLAFPETGSLPDASLGSLLAQANSVVKFAAALKEEAQRRLLRGEDVPGFHLVTYTAPRTWTEDAAEELADVEWLWTEPKLVTPKQAIALAGLPGSDVDLDKVEPLVVESVKRPVIGSVDDRRAKWEDAAPEAMFPEVMFPDEVEPKVKSKKDKKDKKKKKNKKNKKGGKA